VVAEKVVLIVAAKDHEEVHTGLMHHEAAGRRQSEVGVEKMAIA